MHRGTPMAHIFAPRKGAQSCQAPNHIATSLENAGARMTRSSVRHARASSATRAGVAVQIAATLLARTMQAVAVPRTADQQAREDPRKTSIRQVSVIRATSSDREASAPPASSVHRASDPPHASSVPRAALLPGSVQQRRKAASPSCAKAKGPSRLVRLGVVQGFPSPLWRQPRRCCS